MPTNINDNIPFSTNHHFKITSLNCRSLVKSNNTQTSSDFIRYLRQLNYDILCLQETHAATFEQQHTLNIKFCIENTIWTKHCGIVSLNPAINLIPHLITLDQRLIACQVTHVNNIFPPFLLINIYAPADERQRRSFYKAILQLPLLMPSAPNPINEEHIPDQFFTEFPPMIILGDFNSTMAQSRLAVNAYFQKALTKALDQFHSHLEIYPSNDSPQQQWDAIKSLVRDIAQKIGRRKHGAHKRMLTRLQTTIEKQIGIIEQEVTETHALRAGTQWQENGEKSAGYLKRIIEQRSVRRNIPSLRHPTTNQLCTSNSELQSATIEFYNNLYTPSPINSIAVSTLAATISSEHQIPLEKQHTLIKPFTFTDIESQSNRSPKKSSPGKDGIPQLATHMHVPPSQEG
ncbi:hypothetical protein G6F56_004324 [Rhizopus delemar]|nr:hypothetical protein G6F56_004324 [Rhizopus delemar]